MKHKKCKNVHSIQIFNRYQLADKKICPITINLELDVLLRLINSSLITGDKLDNNIKITVQMCVLSKEVVVEPTLLAIVYKHLPLMLSKKNREQEWNQQDRLKLNKSSLRPPSVQKWNKCLKHPTLVQIWDLQIECLLLLTSGNLYVFKKLLLVLLQIWNKKK